MSPLPPTIDDSAFIHVGYQHEMVKFDLPDILERQITQLI